MTIPTGLYQFSLPRDMSLEPTQRSKPKERLLDAARVLFYSEGIRSVGVDRIAAHAQVTKATLYRLFENKEDLVVSYLRQRHHEAISYLENSGSGLDDVRAQILATFDSLRSKANRPEFRGCAFVMAVNEHPESEPISAVAQEHKRAVKDYFISLLKGFQRPAELAGYLATLYDGALAGVSVQRNAAPVDIAKACATRLIDCMAPIA
jgi:AcrR family transcriptional regulator